MNNTTNNSNAYKAPSAKPPRLPAGLGGVLSIVPGLGQMLSGYFMRGFLLLFFIVSLYGLSYWRIVDADIEASIIPPSVNLDDLNKAQSQAVTYAVLATVLTVLVHLWNIYDGYTCAKRNPSPIRLAGAFLAIATLIIGAHITEIDIGKAVREVGDVQPRLVQILWPWDDAWERDIEENNGVGYWQTPCEEEVLREQPDTAEGEPYLVVSPLCGEPSGIRQPNGSREEGTTVHVEGFNFRPDEEAEVIVKPSSIPEFRVVMDGERLRVTPDDHGKIEFEFIMPNFTIPSTATGAVPVDITVRQEQEVGSLKPNQDFKIALEAIVETIFLALMATAAGLVLAVPVSFLAARNLMLGNPVTYGLYYVVRLILNVVRSIEPLVWALIAIIWVGPGPFAGVIALTLHTIAALGKLYSEAIENIETGPIEAIQATGANRLQTIIYAVVPQVIPPFVSFTIYRWDINVRMSTIIGAVGGGGIGFFLFQWIRLADYDSVGIAVWMIAIVVTILDYLSARIREAYV